MAKPLVSKKAPKTQGTASTYLLVGNNFANIALGAPANLAIPDGPTKTLIIDHISAFVKFGANFVQDPFFTLSFSTAGVGGQHCFIAERLPTTASTPEGYQLYVLSPHVRIPVDGGTGVTFQGEYMPADVSAALTLNISGHFA